MATVIGLCDEELFSFFQSPPAFFLQTSNIETFLIEFEFMLLRSAGGRFVVSFSLFLRNIGGFPKPFITCEAPPFSRVSGGNPHKDIPRESLASSRPEIAVGRRPRGVGEPAGSSAADSPARNNARRRNQSSACLPARRPADVPRRASACL